MRKSDAGLPKLCNPLHLELIRRQALEKMSVGFLAFFADDGPPLQKIVEFEDCSLIPRVGEAVRLQLGASADNWRVREVQHVLFDESPHAILVTLDPAS